MNSDAVKVDKTDKNLHGSAVRLRCVAVGCRAKYVAYFGFSGSFQTSFIINESQTLFALFKGLLMISNDKSV